MEIINIPQNIKINTYQKKKLSNLLSSENYLRIEGILGSIEVIIPEIINLVHEKNFLKIIVKNNEKFSKSYKTTFQKVFITSLRNSLRGLSNGFYSDLLIRGTGYKAIINKLNKSIEFKIGKTHIVIKKFNSNIKVFYKIKPRKLYLSSYDKQKVTQFSSEIRDLKRPDPYKAKGIRRVKEIIIRKEGKKSRK